MKENIKKIKIFSILLLMINIHCSSIQNNANREFDSYMKNIINNKNFLFLEIDLVKKCNNSFLFSLSKMNFADNLPKRYKLYTYKKTLIIYVLNEKEDHKEIITFFDNFFEKTTFDLSSLPTGSQSIINAKALYFEGYKFVNNEEQIHFFMVNDCGDK